MLDASERAYLRVRLAGDQPKLWPLNGEYVTLQQAYERSGINVRTLRTRLYRDGFTMAEAMAHPVGRRRSERTGKRYLFRGEWLTIREIAALAGISEGTAYARRSGDRVMEEHEAKAWHRDQPAEPSQCHRMVTYRGKTQCLADWALELGMSRWTLYQRLRKGWSLTRAFREPVMNADARKIYQGNRRTIRRIEFAFTHETTPNSTTTDTKTGGRSETFTNSLGTGVGTSKTDFERERHEQV